MKKLLGRNYQGPKKKNGFFEKFSKIDEVKMLSIFENFQNKFPKKLGILPNRYGYLKRLIGKNFQKKNPKFPKSLVVF